MSSKVVLNFPGGEVLQVDGPPEFIEKLLKGDSAAHVLQALRNPPASSSEGVVLEQGLEHTWEWFSLHAGHRMQAVNFFLVAVAFLCAGYVTAFRFAEPTVAFGVSLVGVLIAICFNLFEQRIRQLIHAGEAALSIVQDRLAAQTGIEQIRILDAVDRPNLWVAVYSRVINTLHIVTTMAFLAGAMYAYKAMTHGAVAPPVAGPAAQSVPQWSAADTQRLAVLAVVILGMYFGTRLLESVGGPRAPDVMTLRARVLAGIAIFLVAATVLLRIAWNCC